MAEDNQVNQLVAVRLLVMDGHQCVVAPSSGMGHYLSKPLRLDALRNLLRPIQQRAHAHHADPGPT